MTERHHVQPTPRALELRLLDPRREQGDYLAEVPIARLGQVDDIARLIRFLAGPESSWITGDAIPLACGHHLRRDANDGLLFDP